MAVTVVPANFLSSHARLYKNYHLKTAQDKTTFPTEDGQLL
jgi:hypothetical protein